MASVLVSKIGKGKRLHMVDDRLDKSRCGRYLDTLEHKFESVSRKSKRICISCRCAERIK